MAENLAPEELGINAILEQVNLAKKLKQEERDKIGQKVVEGYNKDDSSRKDWKEKNSEYLKLAAQVKENKTFPWPDAANVKYPLLTTACLQFAARAYPSLISSFDIVKAKAIGPSVDDTVREAAAKISTHMSYQILYKMHDWEEDMDKLCFILPISGCCFKKTYFSKKYGVNKSDLILARDLVVDYWTSSLAKASRITHRVYMTPNEIKEYQNAGIFLEYDDITFGPGNGTSSDNKTKDDIDSRTQPTQDEFTPRQILEQHTYYDLDGDDYLEPYVITVDYETGKLLRMTARFEKEGVSFKKNSAGEDTKEIECIEPLQYFTKFPFIPNPDGGFYDVGFGLLLGGINEAANTCLNQLLDAGTLSNLQAGFISKGIRISAKTMKLRPGEWVPVNNFGDDLKKGIFPLPVKEPSQTLFQLLGMLVQSGKELASIAEIFTGKMPGQNTPAATTMASIEQGMKVFTSIYKRIYRSLGQEFVKLYDLNKKYLPKEGESFTLPQADGEESYGTVSPEDYEQSEFHIVPAADPNMVSDTQKLVKSQGLMEIIKLGTVNPQEATKQILENQDQTNIKALMTMPEQQPPIELQLKQMELQVISENKDKELQIKLMEVQNKAIEQHAHALQMMAQAKASGDDAQLGMLEVFLQHTQANNDRQHAMIETLLNHKQQQDQMQQQSIAPQGA